MIRTCSRESEVKDLLQRGYWPEACPSEIVDHVKGCKVCCDLVLVTQAFQRERTAASAAARLQSPGVLLWRAQLLRRNAAVEKMGRPLLGAYIFSAVVSLIAVAAFLVWQWQAGADWMGRLAEVGRVLHFESLLPDALQNSAGIGGLAVGLVALIVAATGALAYATSDKH